MFAHTREADHAVLIAHRALSICEAQGHAADGWKMEFLGAGIKLIVRGRPLPGPGEFGAEENIQLNKEARFWIFPRPITRIPLSLLLHCCFI